MGKKYKTATIEIKIIVEIDFDSSDKQYKRSAHLIRLADQYLSVKTESGEEINWLEFDQEVKVLDWCDTPIE